jgi:hypothetical protein
MIPFVKIAVLARAPTGVPSDHFLPKCFPMVEHLIIRSPHLPIPSIQECPNLKCIALECPMPVNANNTIFPNIKILKRNATVQVGMEVTTYLSSFPNLESLELGFPFSNDLSSEMFASMTNLRELCLPRFCGKIHSLPKGLITFKLSCGFIGNLPELPSKLEVLSLEEPYMAEEFICATNYQTCELPPTITILKCGNYRFPDPLPPKMIYLSMNTLPRTIFLPPSVKELQLRNYCESTTYESLFSKGFDTWFDFKHITKFTFYGHFLSSNLNFQNNTLRHLDMPNWFIHKNTQSQLLPHSLETLKILSMKPDVILPNAIRYLHFYGKVADDVKSLPSTLLQLTFQNPNVQPFGLLQKAYHLADIVLRCY